MALLAKKVPNPCFKVFPLSAATIGWDYLFKHWIQIIKPTYEKMCIFQCNQNQLHIK